MTLDYSGGEDYYEDRDWNLGANCPITFTSPIQLTSPTAKFFVMCAGSPVEVTSDTTWLWEFVSKSAVGAGMGLEPDCCVNGTCTVDIPDLTIDNPSSNATTFTFNALRYAHYVGSLGSYYGGSWQYRIKGTYQGCEITTDVYVSNSIALI